MKPVKRYRSQIEPSVERLVYELAIQGALDGVKPLPNLEPSVHVFRLPKGAKETEYLAAACRLMVGLDDRERLEVLAPYHDRKGRVVFDDVIADISEGKGAIILVGHNTAIPPTIIAAADCLVDLDPVSSEHLRAAQKMLSLALSVDQADQLLCLPLDLVFAAIRPGRSFDEIVERVRTSERPKAKEPPTLEELGGYGAAKSWGLALADDIRALRAGEIGWDDIEAGILLSGPPGIGKTLYAAALARSCSVNFVATSVAQWQSTGHLGDLLGAMRASFKQASEAAPCMLFLDEFDSVGDRARFRHDNAVYSTQVVNGLLEAIDGSNGREGVVIVAASNHPETIDPAFLRAGRLGRHIRIGLPGFDDRKAIIRTYFPQLASDADVERVAGATKGLTGADFADLAKAARRKGRTKRAAVDVDLLISCLPPALPLTGEDRRTIGVHEAGHAVVGLTIGIGELNSVAVVNEIREGTVVGGGAFFVMQTRAVRTRESYLDEICVRLGGVAAEKVVLGTVTDGAGGGDGGDLSEAADVATRMVVHFGMGDVLRYTRSSMPEDRDRLRRTSPDVSQEVTRILTDQLERATAIIREKMSVVEELARLLDEQGFAEGAEVEEMMKRRNPPQEDVADD